MDLIWGYFNSFMQTIGLFKKKANIVLIGLDNAGKTTYLAKTSSANKFTAAAPTFHPNVEEITTGNVTFTATDVGGHLEAREIWREHYMFVDGIIFMVDAADHGRMQEAKNEIQKILQDKSVNHIPFAIVANKIDVPDSLSEEQLTRFFEIGALRTGKDGERAASESRKLELFMISLKQLPNFWEPLQWLSKFTN